MEKEKKNLTKKIIDYKNNQDQMILLIKIIQECGVDIDQLIDEYNNNITKEDSNKNNDDEEKIIYESSISNFDIKAESNSFIPITLEKDCDKKISKIKIPKLKFENIYSKNLHNKNYNKKQK